MEKSKSKIEIQAELNIVKEILKKSKKGGVMELQFQMSDILMQQYHSQEQIFSEQMLEIPVLKMQIMSKKLDQPLPWYKNVFATIANIKTEHQFLLFTMKEFLMTVDFYKDNQILVTFGDQKTVLKKDISQSRQNSVISIERNGLEWKKCFQHSELKVGQLVKYFEEMNIQSQFSQASHNGSHFSRNIWVDVNIICKK